MKDSVDDAIRQIAAREGISEEAVLQELQQAIDAGYEDPDPSVQEYWRSLPFAGKPTPQQLIAYLVEEIQSEIRH